MTNDTASPNLESPLGYKPLDPRAPAWLRDVSRFLAIRSQFVLSGAIGDLVLMPEGDGDVTLSLRDALDALLEVSGYHFLLCYDPFDYLQVHAPQHRRVAAVHAARAATGAILDGAGRGEASVNMLIDGMKKLAASPEHRGALLIDHSARLTEDERRLLYGAALKLSQTSLQLRMADGRARYNPIFWAVTDPSDLPVWLTLRNERIRQQTIPLPDLDTRTRAARELAPSMAGWDRLDASARDQVSADFARATESVSLAGMVSTTELARDQGFPADQVLDAVRLYKLGVVENRWKTQALRTQITDAETSIQKQVKGQRQAITKSIDILKRSAMGLSGAQASANSISGRPRGTLFFAGPTGVGKTELAKAITTLLFGDERAYIRFDMSEFASEHAKDRLIGAPPGYTGHESGGELTKAIRQRPFSVVLFDEIEKAHPRIMDIFLQILEDGRLTDTHGETVYFSESIIIFTSNLGIYRDAGGGERVQNVDPAMTYAEIDEKVKAEIASYFKFRLGRPEILNRIGDNIVVFHFITRQIAREIFDKQISHVVARVLESHAVRIVIPDDILEKIFTLATEDLSNGGRGIGNQLETILVNPLSRTLFDSALTEGSTVRVRELHVEDDAYRVTLE